jgi:hypothetical protein
MVEAAPRSRRGDEASAFFTPANDEFRVSIVVVSWSEDFLPIAKFYRS